MKQFLLVVSAALLLTSCEYYGPEPVKEESAPVIVAAPAPVVVPDCKPAAKRKVAAKLTPQQEVMRQCNIKAKNRMGNDRREYMRECLKAVMAMPAPAARPPFTHYQAP